MSWDFNVCAWIAASGGAADSALLCGIAFLLSALLIPLLIRLAPHCGLIDLPDGHRKLQSFPVPLGGGVAIVLALLATLGLAVLAAPVGNDLLLHWRFMLGLTGAAGLICVVGVLDDVYEIRGRQKLAAQVIAVGLIVYSGLVIHKISVLGWEWELGLLAVPFTIAWLVGAINAINLIDGLDGLAGTVSIILASTIGVLAVVSDRPADAVYCWILVGGTLGFLIHNWFPARVYLGDAGSMAIGLVLGVLAMRVSLKEATTLGLSIPVVIWAVLFFDVAMAILRRRLTGQSIYATDRAHIHHVLQRHGFSVPMVVGVIGTACLMCCLGVLAGVWFQSDLVAISVAATVLTILVASGLFGDSEFRLCAQRLGPFVVSLVRFSHRRRTFSEPIASRFHGVRAWEHLWAELIAYSDRFDLSTVQLNVSAPSIGEEYHASWERKESPDRRTLWRSEIPLLVGNLAVGRLTVSGKAREGGTVDWMTELVSGLKPFEIQMESILQSSSVHELPVWTDYGQKLLRATNDENGASTTELKLAQTEAFVTSP